MDQLHKKRRSPLWGALAPIMAGLAFGLTPLYAAAQDEQSQEEDADDAQNQEETAPDIERMVVTGSRLRTNPNVVAPNPVLTVGQEEIDARGVTRIEDLTNELPQVFAGQSTEVSNGATGTATLNLRGLGAIRTLPLIDGRRLPFGSPFSSPANVNVVPTGLIERIEIVTGGASAVYGSDAVAGVVNFILKRDFEGIEFDMQGAFNQAGNDDGLMDGVLAAADVPDPDSTIDGRELRVTLTIGANTPDGRGNVTSYLQYENLNAITQDGRDGSACALGSSSGPNSFKGVGCVGSSNFRRFFGLATGIDRFQLEDGTLKPFEGGPSETFNFGPFNFFQRPVERFQIFSRARYEITDDIEAFADLSFNNTKSDAQVAPSASFGFWDINCNNPLIQTQQPITLAEVFGCTPNPETGEIPNEVPIFASHRMVEGGPRFSELDITTWRTIGGLRGTLFEEYEFELFGQFARVLETDISRNDLVIENVQDAFFVVEDENGNPVCRSGNPACVPFNIFQRNDDGTTRVTQEMVDFVSGVGITTGETNQWVFGGNIQTDLGRFGIQSPFADAAPGLLVGGEFREDQLVASPDEISQQSDGGFTGVGGPTLPVSGSVEVYEFYLESQIPLITDAPFFESLSIGGAYRYSDYTTEDEDTENGFTTDTWHVFANWQPVEDLRLRGQFQRAVRAPNVIELFTPQGTNLPNLTPGDNGFFDPCAGPNPSATLEQCMRTGVTAAQFGNIPDVISGQTQSITGGNPNLSPEESDTITFGAIVTPRAIPGLSVSVDYFDIEVDDAIGTIPAQTILDECIASGDPTFCNLITRDRVGSLIAGTPGVGFDAFLLNIAGLETSGVDFQVIYDIDLWDIGLEGLGSLRIDYAATYLDELSTTPFPGASPIKCAGKVLGACGSPNPEYRHRMLNTWQTPWNFTVTATWRYFSSTDNAQGQDVLPFTDREAERKQYLDLSVNWAATDTIEFRAGVNNVTGTDFPILTSAGPALGNGNTFPSTFDTGRFFFFGATYRL
ncbi:MAG: TonB-dependent receptor [Wenzhouxiangellaceae bacterium]|nr:TonB-dependent receptor [Wenzhouxiangellaceae bacterium]